MQCCIQCTALSKWLHSYDSLQSCAIVLLCMQVVCSLLGSVGAFYTGLLVANLALALFGLVAIESCSQNLGRAYAVLLGFSLLVDIAWFILFSLEKGHAGSGDGSLLSVNIVFWMQVTSFSLRLLSSFVWIQMYRIGAATDTLRFGASADTSSMFSQLEFRWSRPSFTRSDDRPSPSHSVSMSEEILGGSIYDPSAFSSVFRCSDEPYFTIPEEKQDAPTYNGPNLSSRSEPADPLLDKNLQPSAAS